MLRVTPGIVAPSFGPATWNPWEMSTAQRCEDQWARVADDGSGAFTSLHGVPTPRRSEGIVPSARVGVLPCSGEPLPMSLVGRFFRHDGEDAREDDKR